MADVKKTINEHFNLKLGRNKSNELERLIYEIYRRNGCNPENILNSLTEFIKQSEIDKGKIFSYSKRFLLKKRFPQLYSRGEQFTPYLNKLDIPKEKQNVNYNKKVEPENVFIEETSEKTKFAETFLKRLPSSVKIQRISTFKKFIKNNKLDKFKLGKRDIFITEENYTFFKSCPCTKFHVGCGYYIMNLVFGCPLDCSYCYLQLYSNSPGVIIKSNVESYFKKFKRLYNKRKKKIFRLGTGEFADSLAFDKYTQYSVKLINFFKNRDVLFEFKTKTDNIDLLLGLQHNKKIVVSWSLNPDSIIEKEEKYTASLKNRLLAAEKCQEFGYRIAFHFDPIIYYESWEKDYKEVIKQLFSTINPPLAWISLGTLRFNPKLKSIIEKRFPESNIVYGELLVGKDKKLRYPKFLRMQIYKNMIEWIREYDKEVGIYLCMESADMWKNTIMPVDSDVENYILYQSIRNNKLK